MHHLECEVANEDGHMDASIKQKAADLFDSYACLSGSAPCAADRLAKRSRRFCTMFAALETSAAQHFHLQPKLHMFQELREESSPGRSSALWTWRDEEFGGSMMGVTCSRRESQSARYTAEKSGIMVLIVRVHHIAIDKPSCDHHRPTCNPTSDASASH